MRLFDAFKRWVRGHLRLLGVLSLTGAVLLACLMQSEFLLLPTWLDSVSRLAYRCAFLLVAPFRILVAFFIPRVDHHWPVSHLVVSSLGAPYFFWFCGLGALRLHRVAMRRRSINRNREDVPMLERRQFLARSMAGVGLAAGGGIGGYASKIDPNDVRVREYEVVLPDLPRELHGLRLLHISDTHYGPYTGLSFLEKVAEKSNGLNADLVLMTGDYVHLTPLSIEGGIEVLTAFNSRYGSLAVMGNHEHWEGTRACQRVFDKISLPLLDNGRIYFSRDGFSSSPVEGRSICIAGFGDLWEDKVDVASAIGDVPQNVPRIVLSHNPDAAEVVGISHRMDLMLSGHTHGGQINLPIVGPPGTGSKHGKKYLGGMCKGPQGPVIVSRGVGTAFIPVRFRVPPEVGIIKLLAAGC